MSLLLMKPMKALTHIRLIQPLIIFDVSVHSIYREHLSRLWQTINSQKMQFTLESMLMNRKRKRDWDASQEVENPYEKLPQLNLYTYQMSAIIEDKVKKGIELADKDIEEYAFDLNEFCYE